MVTKGVVAKYLTRYAEDVAGLAVPGHYERTLVVPWRDESIRALGGWHDAWAAATALVIVVFNASTVEQGRSNATAVRWIRDRWTHEQPLHPKPEVFLGTWRSGPLLLIVDDNYGPRDGVGRARKQGMDLALALHHRGQVRTDWLHTTDADTMLSDDALNDPSERPEIVAATLPFEHVPGEDAAVHRATCIYELSLRHYQRGVRSAGSPYDMLPLGSALAVRAQAYAQVRGVPPRAGGEDFYLLQKLSKLGTIATPRRRPRRILSRRSERIPFGTGPGIDKVLANQPCFHDPRAFAGLASRLREGEAATAQRRRFHEQFDALATLQFLRRQQKTFPLRTYAEATAELGELETTLAAWRDEELGRFHGGIHRL